MCRSTVEKEQVFLNQNSAGGSNDGLLKDIGGHVDRMSIAMFVMMAFVIIMFLYFAGRIYKSCHQQWYQREFALNALERIRRSLRGRNIRADGETA